jgi:hypothetical protein
MGPSRLASNFSQPSASARAQGRSDEALSWRKQ